jgi:hypothetical protein
MMAARQRVLIGDGGQALSEGGPMPNGATSSFGRRVRSAATCAALALACVGCGADEPGRHDGVQDGPNRVAQVSSQMRVAPTARVAIQRMVPRADVANVACAPEVIYFSEGAVANCTAKVDNVLSGWRLSFLDASGAHSLARRPGAPWQFR